MFYSLVRTITLFYFMAGLLIGSANAQTEQQSTKKKKTKSQTQEMIQVSIAGVDEAMNTRLSSYLETAKPDCMAARWLVERYADNNQSLIENGLKSVGYYATEIQQRITNPQACWTLTYAIEKGPPVVLRDVQIKVEGVGEEESYFESLIENTRLSQNAQLNHEHYTAFKQQMLVAANSNGYLDAFFKVNKLAIYPDQRVADVQFQLQTGGQYRLTSITFNQEKEILEQTYLEQLLKPQQGAVFSQELLAEIRQALTKTGYFNSIDLITSYNKSNQEVNLQVNLTASTKYEYTVGVGVSTDVGPRLRAGYDNYRVNRRGHSYAFNSIVSGVSQELTFQYQQPVYSDPLNRQFNYSGGFKKEDIDAGQSTTFSIGAAYSIKNIGNWFTTSSLELLYEDFEEQDSDIQTLLLIPGYSWSYARSDKPFYTEKGFRTTLSLKGASEDLLSDASFLSLYAEAKWVRALSAKNRVILKGGVGAIATSDLQELPLSLKYFAGGDNSIRGYSYKSIGPTNDEGNIIGGKFLAQLSGEFEHRITGPWGAAVFIDAGDAFTDNFTINRGVGFGVRWYSPIGPVRVDIGHPLDDSDSNFQLHLSIGQDI